MTNRLRSPGTGSVSATLSPGSAPGDVLLYRGKGLISDAIRFLDRSEVSHAGLFLGRHGEQGRTVGEAIREGVIRRELPKSIEHAEWVESRRLKEAPASLDPVLDREVIHEIAAGQIESRASIWVWGDLTISN